MKHYTIIIYEKIYNIRKESEKQQKNYIYKNSREEVLIVYSTKKNVELFDTINKLSKELENNYKKEIYKRRIKKFGSKINNF